MSEPTDIAGNGDAGRLAYLPVSLFGSVMALCGLALAWRLAAANFGLPALTGEVFGLLAAGIFVALAVCYGIKCVASSAAVRTEFAHPVAVNFHANPLAADFRRAAACAAQPSLMILVATFAVGFSAYLSIVGRVDLFASSLFCVAVFIFTVLVPRLLRLRSSVPFHASWWAVTFPLAAMSNAALTFAMHQPSWPAQAFALSVLAFTTLVVLSQGARTIAGIAPR